jgi:hypothetical protein
MAGQLRWRGYELGEGMGKERVNEGQGHAVGGPGSSPSHSGDVHGVSLKGKCARGPFLSILVIECQHKCLNVNQCPWMNKVQI